MTWSLCLLKLFSCVADFGSTQGLVDCLIYIFGFSLC